MYGHIKSTNAYSFLSKYVSDLLIRFLHYLFMENTFSKNVQQHNEK